MALPQSHVNERAAVSATCLAVRSSRRGLMDNDQQILRVGDNNELLLLGAHSKQLQLILVWLLALCASPAPEIVVLPPYLGHAPARRPNSQTPIP